MHRVKLCQAPYQSPAVISQARCIMKGPFGVKSDVHFCYLRLHSLDYVCKKFSMKLRDSIEQVWQNRELLAQTEYQNAVREVIEEVDKGRLRVADPPGNEKKRIRWMAGK